VHGKAFLEPLLNRKGGSALLALAEAQWRACVTPQPVLALRFVAAISLFESIQHGDAAAFRLLADPGDE
jgi:hypothetical protein